MFMVSLAACSGRSGEEAVAPGSEPGKMFKNGMTLKYTDNGKKVWEIFADSLIQKEEETSIIHASSIKISFFGIDGTIENTVEADKARVDLTTNDVVLTDNVILTNLKKGTRAYMERLDYLSAENRVFSDTPVKIEQDGGYMEGAGMEMDLVTNEITIREPQGRN